MSGEGLGSDDVDVALRAPDVRNLEELGFPRFQVSVRERRQVRHPESVKRASHAFSRICLHGETLSSENVPQRSNRATRRLLVMRFGSTGDTRLPWASALGQASSSY